MPLGFLSNQQEYWLILYLATVDTIQELVTSTLLDINSRQVCARATSTIMTNELLLPCPVAKLSQEAFKMDNFLHTSKHYDSYGVPRIKNNHTTVKLC
jgi:hypothetical protein